MHYAPALIDTCQVPLPSEGGHVHQLQTLEIHMQVGIRAIGTLEPIDTLYTACRTIAPSAPTGGVEYPTIACSI